MNSDNKLEDNLDNALKNSEDIEQAPALKVQEIDVFISYSSLNKNVADAVVANFEQHGIRCWYAPRDIMPGQEWVVAIHEAINASKLFILIYTDSSNESKQVANEVALAFNSGKTLIPFRLSDAEMSSELEYYLTRVHWLDAVKPPLMKSIDSLREYSEKILQGQLPKESKIKNATSANRNRPASWIYPVIVGIVAGFCLVLILVFRDANRIENKNVNNADEISASNESVNTDQSTASEKITQEAANSEADKTEDKDIGSEEKMLYPEKSDVKDVSEKKDKENSDSNNGIEINTDTDLKKNDSDMIRNEPVSDNADTGLTEISDNKTEQENVNNSEKNVVSEKDSKSEKEVEPVKDSKPQNETRPEKETKSDKDNSEKESETAKDNKIDNEDKSKYAENGEADKELQKNENIPELTDTPGKKENAENNEVIENGAETANTKENEITTAPEQNEDSSKDSNDAPTDIDFSGDGKTTEEKTDGEVEDPETGDPETENSETENSETENFETENPVTENPDSEEPVTENPDSEEPVTENPETEDPVIEDPGSEIKALYEQAYSYQSGENVENNYELAYECYIKTGDAVTEDSKIADAMYKLGRRFCDGIGVTSDYDKAYKLFEKAMKSGNTPAVNALGNMYFNGDGVDEDYSEAFEYYEKAAGSGDATGMYNVAFMYENGYGVDADIEKAKKYYKMAADNGYSAGEIAFKRLNK